MNSQISLFDLSHNPRYLKFLHSELGRLHQSIPFDELASCFPKRKTVLGRKPWFSAKGGLGLMFLKSYLNLSDAKLLDRINTDYALQYFCFLNLADHEVIKDKDIVSRWRRYFAEHMNMDELQKVFAQFWSPHIQTKHMVLMDATCYESLVRYPTDVKIVWESCEFVHQRIKQVCRALKVRRPRYKFTEQKNKFLAYQKSRKKSIKMTRKRHRSLIYLLNKMLELLDGLCGEYQFAKKHVKKLSTISQVLEQQQFRFTDPDVFYQIKDRIISISKPYLHPIVRGKETKRVEFGAKVNMIQVDGINFINKISFHAFNESTALKDSVIQANHLMKVKISQLGADQIYATNANRKFCTFLHIATNFVRKGRASKLEDQASVLRKQISIGRATVLEGSFGNEKNHYGLNFIKAKTENTEKLWIFFGVMTANAVKISRRKFACSNIEKAA